MKGEIKPSVINWFLGENNPSVRYFALVDLLDRPPADMEAARAKRDIMISGVVPRILTKQHEGGYWETPERFYTAKYKGTVWQLIILAELDADGGDTRVRKACEFIFENSQDRESGGFSTDRGKNGPLRSRIYPCLTGNMVWSLIRLGYIDDPRVQQGIDWITTYQRFDDGAGDPKGWPYDHAEICWGRHTCHMGAAKSLKALAEIPAGRRSKAVRDTIERGAEYFLKHHVYRKSHDLRKTSKPGWSRFSFPLMYQTDTLEILGLLTKLGFRDDRMREAVGLVDSKQDKNGRWKLASTFNGRFQTNIEQKGKASKWITLKALTALKRFNGQ